MSMIKSRNLTSHTYRDEVAREIYENIVNRYFQAFVRLEATLNNLDDIQS